MRPNARHDPAAVHSPRKYRSKTILKYSFRPASFVAALSLTLGMGLLASAPLGAQTRAPVGDTALPAASLAVAAPRLAPAAPPATICGNSAETSGPSAAPSGAVTVPAGDNSAEFAYQLPASTTYWFAPGTHTLGSGQYASIQPDTGDIFIGAPGAILSGGLRNDFAFVGSATGVTVEYLTIANFTPPGEQGVVNHDAAPDWTILHNTIRDNSPGSGLYIGTNNVVKYNCITANGQQGFGTYTTIDTNSLTTGPSNLVIVHNEISYNNTCNWEAVSPDPVPSGSRPANCGGAGEFNGCGCSGGGKFWTVYGAVAKYNYVHDNYSVGLWADTDNTGLTFQGNYFSGNYDVALVYEISYNAVIDSNTFVDNSWKAGAASSGFPTAAIYISESGGDSRVPGPNSGLMEISNNVMTDNWGGIVLWENPNRFCSDGYDDMCTLVDPGVYTINACKSHLGTSSPGRSPDYYDNCRWKTQNVSAHGNQFNLTPANIGSNCTAANNCGFIGLFSAYGSTAPYGGWSTDLAISDNQNNVFQANSYAGPWRFLAFGQGDTVTYAQWHAGFADPTGSGDRFNPQDAASTYTP